MAEGDHRSAVNSQDYTKTCNFTVIFVADYNKMTGDEQSKAVTAGTDAGFIAQNIYLYCASAGLAGVVHGTVNRADVAKLLKLPASKHVVIGHSVGVPAK